MSNKESNFRIIAQNRRASFDYELEEKFEAGIVLKGSEVKSLRHGSSTINEAYADIKDGEVYLINAYIPEYLASNQFNHEARRPRKLLLKNKEIKKLFGKIKIKGMTLIPLSIYFNQRNYAKVSLALGKGKKLYDKRESIKEKDLQRERSRGIE